MSDAKTEERLLNLLCMDFDDMQREDTNYFRNRVREEFHVSADYITLNRDVCRTAFCLLKRKYIRSLETILIQPRTILKDGGTFGVRTQNRRPPVVPVWDNLHREKVGSFTVVTNLYPVIDVRFIRNRTIVTLLVEQGFIDVDDVHLDFTIV